MLTSLKQLQMFMVNFNIFIYIYIYYCRPLHHVYIILEDWKCTHIIRKAHRNVDWLTNHVNDSKTHQSLEMVPPSSSEERNWKSEFPCLLGSSVDALVPHGSHQSLKRKARQQVVSELFRMTMME
jgi:hypothetical protein